MAETRARDVWLLALVGVAGGGFTGRWLLDTASEPLAPVLDALHAHADPVTPARPPSRRVVVAVLDGLARSRFHALLDRGAFGGAPSWVAEVDVGSPSLSRPVYHALLTGVPQRVAGVGNNAHRGPARADTLAHRVRDAGGSVAWFLQTVPWFHDLGGAPNDTDVVGRHLDSDFLNAQRRGANFTVLHLTVIDDAGHAYGAASERYASASDECAQTVRTLRARPESEGVVWFVGADHGHLARGGHGGPEPDVTRVTWAAFDPSVREGVTRVPGVVPVESIAPTVARVMGVAPPRHALGAALPFPGTDASRDTVSLDARRAAVRDALSRTVARNRAAGLVRVGLALTVAAIFAWRRERLRAGLWALVVVAACVLGLVAANWPVLSLSAIVTHARFLGRTVAGMVLASLPAMALARSRGARDEDVLAASLVAPLIAWAYTGGASGAVLPEGALALLLPSAGLVPISVVGAWVISRGLRRARRARGS